MRVYADTNVFTNLWLNLSHTEEALHLIQESRRDGLMTPVTRLLRMELTNAIQRLVYESKHNPRSFRVSPEAALVAMSSFDEELRSGDVLQWRPLDEGLLESAFETLAYRHTAAHGFRTYDILHVASALLLGCETFWSFDGRAKELAKLEGLRTNP